MAAGLGFFTEFMLALIDGEKLQAALWFATTVAVSILVQASEKEKDLGSPS